MVHGPVIHTFMYDTPVQGVSLVTHAAILMGCTRFLSPKAVGFVSFSLKDLHVTPLAGHLGV